MLEKLLTQSDSRSIPDLKLSFVPKVKVACQTEHRYSEDPVAERTTSDTQNAWKLVSTSRHRYQNENYYEYAELSENK